MSSKSDQKRTVCSYKGCLHVGTDCNIYRPETIPAYFPPNCAKYRSVFPSYTNFAGCHGQSSNHINRHEEKLLPKEKNSSFTFASFFKFSFVLVQRDDSLQTQSSSVLKHRRNGKAGC